MLKQKLMTGIVLAAMIMTNVFSLAPLISAEDIEGQAQTGQQEISEGAKDVEVVTPEIEQAENPGSVPGEEQTEKEGAPEEGTGSENPVKTEGDPSQVDPKPDTTPEQADPEAGTDPNADGNGGSNEGPAPGEDENAEPEAGAENDDEATDEPEMQMLQAETTGDFVLTNDATGEVVKAWNVGEEKSLIDFVQNLNNPTPDAGGTIYPLGPHTLTLHADLIIPEKFKLQNQQTLTIQSAAARNTIRLNQVTHSTPVNEEIIDGSPGVHLTLKNLIFEGLVEGVPQSRGIHIQDEGTLIASGCVFQNCFTTNETWRAGKAIQATNARSIILSDCIFQNNGVDITPAGAIGIVNVPECRFTKLIFKNNRGKYGGAVVFQGDQTKATLTQCTFESNVATSSTGGAIYVNKADVTINGCQFTSNQAQHGGAIIIFSNSHLTINGTTFNENEAKSRGGAVVSQAPIEVNNSYFMNNFAANQGGAIDQDYAKMTITNTVFENNSAGTDGGAIMLWSDGEANIANSTQFTNNKSGSFGGAICDEKSSYEDPADSVNGYTNLTTDATTVFENNSAPYLYNPPSNYSEFSWIEFARTSFTETTNPNTQKPVLDPDFPLNNFDINYLNDPGEDLFPVTFEYQSRNSEATLPQAILESCPKEFKAPLHSLVVPGIVPPVPVTREYEIDGQLWRFDIWEPGSAEVTEDGLHFIGYWIPVKETVDITVTKVWQDHDNLNGNRPDNVTVRLFASGEDIGKTLLLQAPEWTGVFTGLKQSEDDHPINYSVREENVPDDYTSRVSGSAEIGFTITNTQEIEKVVRVTKIWNDHDNQEGMRPSSVTFRLQADGKMTDQTLALSAADHWMGEFRNLERYSGDRRIVYRIVEDPVEGYASDVSGDDWSGFDVTNTYVGTGIEPSESTEPTTSSEPTESTTQPSSEGTSPEPTTGPTTEPTTESESTTTPEPSEPTTSSTSPEATTSSETTKEPEPPTTPTSTTEPGLPQTGEALGSTLWIGFVLLAAGVGLFLIRRRMKRDRD